MISVGRLAPTGQWDQTLIEDLLTNRLYPTGLNFEWHDGYPSRVDGCVLILPSRYWAGHEAEISMAVAKYRWIVFVLTSDEEQLLDAAKLVHPNARFWIQTPREGRTYPEGSRFIGVGYTPHFRDLPSEPPVKSVDVVLSAQNTHARRNECFEALTPVRDNWQVVPTEGFTKGVPPWCYTRDMLTAKVAPAPSGAVSPDSFRLFEALEAHCIPIADAVSPVDDLTEYWQRLFPDAPFPIVEDWESIDFDWLLRDWVEDANIITAWWMRQKRRYAHWLVEDLEALGAI